MVYIIGTGIMGSAIAKVLAKKGQKVFVFDTNAVKAKNLAKQKNIFYDKNFSKLSQADFVVVAVKPYDIAVLAEGIRLPSATVIVSIAAGVKISKLKTLFKQKKVLRVMPNLGLLVNQGIAVWKSEGLNFEEKVKAKKFLDKVSENFEVKNEKQIDAFTAVAGSGPAYFFYLALALEQAAKTFGFDSKVAKKIVEKTFFGAAALQTGSDYQDLISRVASKKGTTEAALKVFEKKYLSKIVKLGVKAAQKRAEEISND